MLYEFSKWFESKPFEQRLLILVLTVDPLGFLLGYVLAPTFGVNPLMGGVYGLFVASIPVSLWALRHAE